jgi:hypothetical protein
MFELVSGQIGGGRAKDIKFKVPMDSSGESSRVNHVPCRRAHHQTSSKLYGWALIKRLAYQLQA